MDGKGMRTPLSEHQSLVGPGRSRVSEWLSQGCCWLSKGEKCPCLIACQTADLSDAFSITRDFVCAMFFLTVTQHFTPAYVLQGSAKSAGGDVSSNLKQAAGDAQGEPIHVAKALRI